MIKVYRVMWIVFWSGMIGWRIALFTIDQAKWYGFAISIPMLGYSLYKLFENEK